MNETIPLNKIIPLYLVGISLFITTFFKEPLINSFGLSVSLYFLIKWITNYRKCTISYMECKLRGVKKENGFLYNFLEPILDVNKRKDRYLIYFLILIIYFINRKNRYGCYFSFEI